MAIGEAGANRFQIQPFSSVGGTQAIQQPPDQGPGPGMGKFPTGLENVQGITRDLYQKWARVNSYAQSMWKNNKINVTAPDFSDPIAVDAHNAFNEAMADLYYSSDVLKNSQKTLHSLAGIIASPDTEVTPHPGRETQLGDIKNYGATDAVKLAQNISRREFRTKADSNKANQDISSLVENAKTQREQMIAQGMDVSEKDNEIVELEAMRANMTPFAPKQDFSTKNDYEWLEKYQTLYSSLWDTGRQFAEGFTGRGAGWGASSERTPSGGIYQQNNNMVGKKMGTYKNTTAKGAEVDEPRIIREWLRDPKTGKVIIRYEGTAKDQQLKTSDFGDKFKTYSSSNTTGFREDDINRYFSGSTDWRIVQLTGDPSGFGDLSNPDTYFEEREVKSGVERATQFSKESEEFVKNKLIGLKELSGTRVPGLGESAEFDTPEFGKLEIVNKGEGRYRIANRTDINDKLTEGSPKLPKKVYTLEEIIAELEIFGYFKGFELSQPSPQNPVIQPDSTTVAPIKIDF